ncbi:DUF2793 domain-containing protein [Hansschlegelia plantiphila]|uniref:Glycine-rich domain-containing protein n=1 Tax=Hansschlegelia plantiphila TaxID=374655 RepID=A0A9W6MUZ5_9HYPH|nr:DUF2793 domain-containing protein [Hansschlegelia plantiphila]GLK67914.1 hypothetical protein GCM10008179_15520 [Hansschlegelia plantiphila]
MSASPHLGLSYLAPAQKHVTVNESFRRLDALVQLGVLDRTLTAPPATPAEGDRHIVAPGAAGAWSGHDGELAAFLDGVWVFVEPKPGWLAYVAAEGALLVFLGGAWVGAMAALASLDELTRLGVATTADDVNRLAVSSAAALFTHAGAGVQVKLNKATPTDTASLLFQDGYSGRAEFGLAGSDGVSLKVSADGASWTTALSVDPSSGAVDLPQSPTLLVEKFTASGTWTKPAWATRVRVILIGGGAGGGSGALRAAGVAVSGGAGGAPGQTVDHEFEAGALSATVAVTVGAGGAGGAAQSTASSDGLPGALGGDTAFGGYVKAVQMAGGFGAGGSTATVAGGTHAGYRDMPPTTTASGGSGATGAGGAGQNGYGRASGPAGGGGGLTAANAEGAGGPSGSAFNSVGAPQAADGGLTPGGPGAAGAPYAGIAEALLEGCCGGGGAAGNAVNGGAGGAGAAPGGAGGGGGASRNGRSSGKGGDGARGEAWIISMR